MAGGGLSLRCAPISLSALALRSKKTGDGFRRLGGFARHVAHDFTPGCDGEFGDEIIAVAAIMGAGEFDNAAIGQIGNALDEQCRAAIRQIEEFGFLRGECGCMQALQGAHRPDAARFKSFIKRTPDACGIGQEMLRDHRQFNGHGNAIGAAQAMKARDMLARRNRQLHAPPPASEGRLSAQASRHRF